MPATRERVTEAAFDCEEFLSHPAYLVVNPRRESKSFRWSQIAVLLPIG
jgi:hypothetical protein